MTSFYTASELAQIGFRSIGTDVSLSRRASVYGAERISIGDHVRIDDYCLLSGHIELGNYIHISAYAALYGGESGIFVEDFCNISVRATILSVNEDFSGRCMVGSVIPEKYRCVFSAPVRLGRHSIVGSSNVVLPGVRIAEGSTFGSFSFINHDSEPWSINAGIPFRKLRDRSRDLERLEREFRRSCRSGDY